MVVQLAVRLHVRELHALRRAERLQRADLVQHVRVRLVGRQVHVAAPEALQIGIARMRADGDAGVLRHAHRLAHDHRIARMLPARDVRAGHKRDDLVVEPQRVAPEALAQVAVQVDAVHRQPSFVRGFQPIVKQRRTRGEYFTCFRFAPS